MINMMETDLVISLFNLGAFLFCAAAAIGLYHSYSKSKESDNVKFFFLSTAFLSLYLLATTVAKWIPDNYFAQMILFLFATIPFFLFLYFFTGVPLRLFHKRRWIKTYTCFMLILLLFAVVFSYLGLRQKNFYKYYNDIMGATAIVSFLFTMAAYTFIAWKKRANRKILKRSLLLSIVCLFFILFAVFDYILVPVTSIAWIAPAGSIFSVLALLLLLLVIFHRKFREKTYNYE